MRQLSFDKNKKIFVWRIVSFSLFFESEHTEGVERNITYRTSHGRSKEADAIVITTLKDIGWYV